MTFLSNRSLLCLANPAWKRPATERTVVEEFMRGAEHVLSGRGLMQHCKINGHKHMCKAVPDFRCK